MWIFIYKEHPRIAPELVGRVAGTNYEKPCEDCYNHDALELKEWDGDEPNLGDLIQGILPDLDPTLADPDYEEKVRQRLDFEELADKADAEVDWLEATIPTIESMTLEELRGVLKRVCQENLETIKAWRYVLRRLA